jgi:RNA polymerase sigma factor (sigma-70 family)
MPRRRGAAVASQTGGSHDVVVVGAVDDKADEALLVAGKSDGEAFGRFYVRRVDAVLAFFLRRTGDRELAADLTAETFAAALSALPRYSPERSSALAWLFTIANHKLVDSIRRGQVEDRARRRLRLEPLVFSDEDIERVAQRAAAAEGGAALLELERLSDAQRDAIEGRVLQETEYDELARRLRCSESVVRKRVSRGLAELRTRMKEA